jgi:POT family proton-dependent oligopeptide transporter
VSQNVATSTTAPPGKHPVGLRVLFLTEMWERFSFYLLIGLLYLYLTDSQTGGMGWSGGKASVVVGSYLGLVYFTPFLGGLLADRVLGYRKAIYLGGFFFILGHSLMAIPNETMLYVSLGCLIVGNGLFKPNISTMVGRLYPPNSPIRDNGYTIFYMGINVGAFACNFVAAIVRNTYGWHAAFATAGVGMAIGMVIFYFGQKHIKFADITAEERSTRKHESLAPLWFECLIPAFALGAIGYVTTPLQTAIGMSPTNTAFILACIPVVVFFVRIWRKLTDPVERGKTGALLAIFGVVVVFWMVFHQNSTALVEWAKSNTDREPSALIEPVVNLAPDFAEAAPPEYFYNAGPEVARPSDTMLTVVTDAEYEQLGKDRKLSVERGKPTAVTTEIREKMFRGASATTPRLPEGEQLRLVNTELFASINGGFVMLLAPLMVALWTFLSRRKREPSTPAKISLGLLLTGMSAVVMIGAVAVAGDGYGNLPEGKATAWWLFGTYFVVTIGELCLSPMGLSLVSKHAPRHLTGFLMGGWFMSTAIGNKLSGVLGELYHEWDHTNFFVFNTVCAVVAAGAIFAMLPWLRRQLSEPKPGAPPPAEVPSARVVKGE